MQRESVRERESERNRRRERKYVYCIYKIAGKKTVEDVQKQNKKSEFLKNVFVSKRPNFKLADIVVHNNIFSCLGI